MRRTLVTATMMFALGALAGTIATAQFDLVLRGGRFRPLSYAELNPAQKAMVDAEIATGRKSLDGPTNINLRTRGHANSDHAALACLLAHQLLEISLLTFGLPPTPVSEPLVGGRKAGPSWNGCSQVYRLPQGMTRRFVELAKLREECIDEFRRPLISLRAFWPVE